VVPNHYELTFTPDLKAATFTGEETIDVTFAKAGNTITMNSAEIKINEVAVTVGKDSQNAKITYDEAKEQVTFTTEKPLPAGPAKIGIRFVGKLNDDLRGFYLSKSKIRNYATTQFESTDARRAFPCFDEPAFKATFDIKIVADKGDTAFSNGKQISDVPGPGEGKHTVTFARTAKMSTYLVAMVVGDLVCQSGEVDGTPLRVCSTPDKEPLLGFALEATQHIVHFYNGYYGIKYPFVKLDQLGIPDFSAGAMENTAAITYRETALLVDTKTGTTNQRKGVAGTIAHEIAHQWFGDLVTMKWWDDIWLNEGFATWMSPKPLQAWQPQWHEDLDEIQGTQDALRLDALASTRPIHQQANTPAEIEALFDGIAYGKTAAVLRMIEHYVSDDAFRKGVNNYLEHHKYSNTEAKDFWTEIATASGKPVDQLMPTFVNQAGAPQITVKSACKAGKTEMTVSQQRLYLDPAMSSKGADQVWQIPVCAKTGANATSCQVVTQKQQTVTLNGCAPWVFANAGGFGYYRTAYDDADVKKFADNAQTALLPGERISFLGDQWAFVNNGQQRLATFMNILNGFQGERSRAVMQSVLTPISYLDERIVDEQQRPAFNSWVKKLLQPVIQQIGMKPKPGEDPDTGVMRNGVMSALGHAGDEQVLTYLRGVLNGYMKDPTSVPPDQVPVAFDLTSMHGDKALYEQFVAHRAAAKNPSEFFRYQDSLTNFRDPELIKRTLEFSLTPEVRTQDLSRMLGGEFGNPAARDQAFEFFKQHFDEIRQKTVAQLGTGFGGVISNFCDEQKMNEVSSFMESKNLQGWARGIRQGKERANACIRFKTQQSESLQRFLKQASGD
jgi:aminopeptidase N/puromycin-sensitive aminopeptidase